MSDPSNEDGDKLERQGPIVAMGHDKGNARCTTAVEPSCRPRDEGTVLLAKAFLKEVYGKSPFLDSNWD